MTKKDGLESLSLTETQVREIIERAARMPARRDNISVQELRAIASELDIDSESLERALSEVLFEAQSTLFSPVPRKTLRVGLGLIAGASLGLATGFLGLAIRIVVAGGSATLGSNAYIDMPVSLLLTALSLTSLFWNKKVGSLRQFLAEVGALWGTYFVGWSIVSGGATADLTAFVLSGVAVSTVVGVLVLRRSPPTGLPSRSDTLAPVESDSDTSTSDQHPPFSQRGLVSPTWLGLTAREASA